MKKIVLLIFVLATAFGAAQSLDMWSWRTEDVDEYNEILKIYQDANPDVTINFEAFLNKEYNTLVSTSLQANEAADIVQTRSYGGVKSWIDAGYLLPLDGKVENLSNYTTGTLDAVRSQENGQVYGVPFAIQVLQMYYNKAIFRELGLSEPSTWQEFIGVNEALKNAGYIPMALTGKDAWMLPIFHTIVGAGTYGGNDFVAGVLDGSRSFTDAEFINSVQSVKLLQEYLPPDVTAVSYSDSQNLFINEIAAMFPGGSWEAANFRQQNPDLELGVFAVPARFTNDNPVSWFVDGSWAITSSTKDEAAAYDFVNWLGSQEFGQAFTDKLSQISPIAGVSPSDDLLNEIVSMWGENSTPYMLLVHFRYGTPSGTTIIGQDIQKLFLGDMTAAEVGTDLQEQMATWFTPSAPSQ